MNIAIPTEVKPQENRISLTPSAVGDLISHGHSVFVQSGAGVGAGFSDEEYQSAGAEITATAGATYEAGELIVKVKEPQEEEFSLLKPEHILFAYLHLAASAELTKSLCATKCSALAFETLNLNGKLPLLEPMSEIAGRSAPLIGANLLSKINGGRGQLLSGVPGVPVGRVVILGGGTAGFNAARIAQGIGADVTLFEINADRMRQIEMLLPTVRTLHSSPTKLREVLPDTDLLIGAVLIPGAAAPKIVSREMLKLMPEGSVFIDIAVDQGGCAESTRPTTHQESTFIEEGVIHYCVGNMPGAYSRTATQALSNAITPWVMRLADHGVSGACEKFPALLSALNCHDNQITCRPVAAAHSLPYQSASASLNLQ